METVDAESLSRSLTMANSVNGLRRGVFVLSSLSRLAGGHFEIPSALGIERIPVVIGLFG